jgi:hypothetical protein
MLCFLSACTLVPPGLPLPVQLHPLHERRPTPALPPGPPVPAGRRSHPENLPLSLGHQDASSYMSEEHGLHLPPLVDASDHFPAALATDPLKTSMDRAQFTDHRPYGDPATPYRGFRYQHQQDFTLAQPVNPGLYQVIYLSDPATGIPVHRYVPFAPHWLYPEAAQQFAVNQSYSVIQPQGIYGGQYGQRGGAYGGYQGFQGTN